MDSQVSNGSSLHDERITNLLLFGFLQNCSNYNFHRELEVLGRELPAPAYLEEDHDDELQTDGNRSSHFLDSEETDSESQEEIIQDIARQLAQIGDRMDHSIHPRLVNNLAIQFMNVNLSEEPPQLFNKFFPRNESTLLPT
ncbi:BH3-interacting domain death agonist isoform X1 [Hyaena hyaena]|uniref:BH3-interacting domain death agonist isoform X1 n=1 Tax=Hyaena hyaena TaxID=95912 RepID=UPI001924980D|nr:BH3-interacting domain death agonist isoform X1 [Hyaena hyaena]